MIEISSSVEKKDPAAAGSFFFWKNAYFINNLYTLTNKNQRLTNYLSCIIMLLLYNDRAYWI